MTKDTATTKTDNETANTTKAEKETTNEKGKSPLDEFIQNLDPQKYSERAIALFKSLVIKSGRKDLTESEFKLILAISENM